jgi:hypothetical protein
MDLTLDYNIELFPLKNEQSFALALSNSLSRGGAPSAGDEDAEEKNVWRPDGKGQQGLEEDYDYVMYGKVTKYPQQDSHIVYLNLCACRSTSSILAPQKYRMLYYGI